VVGPARLARFDIILVSAAAKKLLRGSRQPGQLLRWNRAGNGQLLPGDAQQC
jgi:hypothetical protein